MLETLQYRNKLNKIISMIALIILLIILLWIVIPSGKIGKSNWIVFFTFYVNGIIWLGFVLYEVKNRPYSFAMLHWSFCLLFFFFSAIVQYSYNKFPWVGYRSDGVLIKTNLILLLWTFSVFIGQHVRVAGVKKIGKSSKSSILNKSVICEKFVKLFIILSFGIMLWRMRTIGITNLLARATSSYSVSENSSISLLLDKCMQAFSYFTAAISIILYKSKKAKWQEAIISCIFLMISYPPTGIARYAAAAIYLGIMLSFFDSLKKTNGFIFIFLGAFALVLPLLNSFRYLAFNRVDLIEVLKNVINSFSVSWLAGDYDAYTLLTLAIEHVENNGITWMRQFVGVALFWVPRVLWQTKPVGSGHYIAQQLGWSFQNLSCPLPAEAFLNAGYIGVMVFGIIIGKVSFYLDSIYWYGDDENARVIDVIYPVILLLFFFMCRGDLLSSTAYMTAYIFVGLLMTSINRYQIKKSY